MKGCNLAELELEPSRPRRITSSRDGQVVAIDLAAGETLDDQLIRGRTWLLVVEGEVALHEGEAIQSGSKGFFVDLEVGDRGRVVAGSDSRLLLCSVGRHGLIGPGLVIDEEGYLET